MPRVLLALAVAAGLAGPGPAQDVPRRLDAAEAPDFRAVGRLNVAGRRFCTATLISERVVATAAHCLYHPRTGARVALEGLRFVAGLNRREHAAMRAIVAAAVPPDFVLDESLDLNGVQADVALLALDAPIGPDEAAAFAPGPSPEAGAGVAIVSYARDRARVPSIQEGCRVPALIGGVAAVKCAVAPGASGAPVFAGPEGARRLVAVISAMGQVAAGGEVALAVLLAPRLAELLAALATAEAAD